MRQCLPILLTLSMPTSACAAPAVPAPTVSALPPATAAELDGRFDRLVAEGQLKGAVLLVMRDGKPVYRRATGGYDDDTIAAVASASKWYHAAVIMALVDQGKLDLDIPLARYLPQAKGSIAKATLRQMLSHSAGVEPKLVIRVATYIPSPAEVDTLLTAPLASEPGTDFRYGGADLQIAGAIAEKVTGEKWDTLFQRLIAKPLGMARSSFDVPATPRTNSVGDDQQLGAGVRTSAHDYAAFLGMLSRSGTASDGKRVLSAKAVGEILHNQIGTLPMAVNPTPMFTNWRYGLGTWCWRIEADGKCSLTASPGLWGSIPFLDTRTNTYAVLIVQANLRQTLRGGLGIVGQLTGVDFRPGGIPGGRRRAQ